MYDPQKTATANNQYLLLWLEAPLQSWGHDSVFGRRDTLDFPTKSGVLGLLCCARGASGPEEAWLSQWDGLDMSVIAYARSSGFANQSPHPPILKDFHMVGSGYNSADLWQDLMIPRKADGNKSSTGGSKMTTRNYIQDTAFAVILQIPENESDNLSESLVSPVWDLYLGRKSCAPVEFIYQGVFDEVDKAKEFLKTFSEQKSRTQIFQVLQGDHEGDRFTVSDTPVCFGANKKYKDRRVTVQKFSV